MLAIDSSSNTSASAGALVADRTLGTLYERELAREGV
jgi:hypothetical protein